jgi:uncharacterized protein (DUF433 family)
MAAEERTDEVEVRVLSQHIVSDPRICHGHLTIRGTRILVSVLLEQVADGNDWDAIVDSWGGKVPREAITEAVLLAHDALVATTGERRTAMGLGLLTPA